jgi:hypothetical protein
VTTLVPLHDSDPALWAGVRGVFTDIDDTLTTGGRVTGEAYGALARLRAGGLLVVPITGRPAGWCDMIARSWPVDGVVGENGAFYFRYDAAARRMLRAYADRPEDRAGKRRRLDALAARILAEVPGCAISADQAYREADLAIDFCEDVTPLPPAAVARIAEIFREEGATAKISSIHVNGWFGSYDKLSMTRRFMAEQFGTDLGQACADYVFIGDSPNDAPMFGFFPKAVGVANVTTQAAGCEALPAFVTRGSHGAGFAELTDWLLAATGRR